MCEVVVVGGGVMGSATAWALAEAGREVVLLERHGPDHERGGSHGTSRLFRLAHDSPDYIRLARRAQRGWRELEAASGTDLLTTTGSVDHGLAPDALEAVEAVLAAEDVPYERLDPAAAGRRWPGIRFATPVLHHPDGGRLHADRAVRAFRDLAVAAGAELRFWQAVRTVSVRDDRGHAAVRVRTGAGDLEARTAVLAVGSWAPDLLAGVVDLPVLRVTQEQPAYFAPHEPGTAWPSFVHWDHGVGPRGDAESYGLLDPAVGVKVGMHAAGPVVDPDRRDFRPVAAGVEALREYARRWLPGVVPDPVRTDSCLYDNTPSTDFVLDRVGPLVVATGFSGHGFKHAPALGRLLAALATAPESDAAAVAARFRLAAHPKGERRRAGTW